MNIERRIKKGMKDGHGLIDVICDLVEASDDIDYHDVADVIKENPTMLQELEQEFASRNMLCKDECEINLTEIFEDL